MISDKRDYRYYLSEDAIKAAQEEANEQIKPIAVVMKKDRNDDEYYKLNMYFIDINYSRTVKILNPKI